MQITDRRRVLRLREDNGMIGPRSSVTRSNTGADVPRLAISIWRDTRDYVLLLGDFPVIVCFSSVRVRMRRKSVFYLFVIYSCR
jgi:hypothetical protein